MWRAGKEQDKGLVAAVVESWDWIHYLVEPDVVEFEFRGHDNDSACANAISIQCPHQNYAIGGGNCTNYITMTSLLSYPKYNHTAGSM